jgi:hypothetical protein
MNATTTDTSIDTVIGTDGIVWTRCDGDHPEAVAHGVLGIARPADIDDVDLATGPEDGETLAACLIRLGRTTVVETAIGDVRVVVSTPTEDLTPEQIAARARVAEWDALGEARGAARAAGLPMPPGGIEMAHGWEPVHPETYDETVAIGWGGDMPTPEPYRDPLFAGPTDDTW